MSDDEGDYESDYEGDYDSDYESDYESDHWMEREHALTQQHGSGHGCTHDQ